MAPDLLTVVLKGALSQANFKELEKMMTDERKTLRMLGAPLGQLTFFLQARQFQQLLNCLFLCLEEPILRAILGGQMGFGISEPQSALGHCTAVCHRGS